MMLLQGKGERDIFPIKVEKKQMGCISSHGLVGSDGCLTCASYWYTYQITFLDFIKSFAMYVTQLSKPQVMFIKLMTHNLFQCTVIYFISGIVYSSSDTISFTPGNIGKVQI